MPAFVGFFIAVVIVLCLAIVLLVGRSGLRLIRRIRSARQRRRAVGRTHAIPDDRTTRADAADRGDATGQAGADPGPGEADAATAGPAADGPDRTGAGSSGPDARRGSRAGRDGSSEARRDGSSEPGGYRSSQAGGARSSENGADRSSRGRDADHEDEAASAESSETAPGPRRPAPDAADGDGPVYVCPQLHATWQDRGTCPECDQRGVPMGG